jgi:hypothetical protein
MGLDTTINGDLPVIGSYYLFAGIGRSYAPESYPYEYNSLIGLVGNTNSLVYSGEFKWNKKFQIGETDIGHFFLAFNMFGRQPRYKTYMGDSVDDVFNETISATYNFPVKALTLNTRFYYFHRYSNYAENISTNGRLKLTIQIQRQVCGIMLT